MVRGGHLDLISQSSAPRYDLRGNTGPFTGIVNVGANIYLRFYGAYGSSIAAFNLGNGPNQLYARNGNGGTSSLGSLTRGAARLFGWRF